MNDHERETMLARYRAVRANTEALAAALSPEDQQVQSMPDASPAKWHQAHVTWFFETFVLTPHAPDYAPFDANFAYLFNSYYEAVGPRHARPERGLLTRPMLSEVTAYRAHVDAAMTRFVETAPSETWQAAADIVMLGTHHEQQHQELLLTDIKHAFSINPLRPAYHQAPDAASDAAAVRAAGWIGYDGGLQAIGHDGNGFGFDNEFPHHKSWLEPFALADRPVTNGEFLAFVEDGGYDEPRFWLSDGWATVRERGWTAPAYWRRRDGEWLEFTLHGEVPLDPATPACHLSFYEADAYARWAGARLPTEAEWEVASRAATLDESSANLLPSGALHPRPETPAGGEPAQMLGDVWEWTGSAYGPYPGYRPAEGAIGEYNGKFMANQMTLRGGSCATPAEHIRITYRNFFYPDQSWQFTGLRLARDAS